MNTISNNYIELHEDKEGYARVHLEMPYPINEVVFEFSSIEEAQAFIVSLENAIHVSSSLTHPQ